MILRGALQRLLAPCRPAFQARTPLQAHDHEHKRGNQKRPHEEGVNQDAERQREADLYKRAQVRETVSPSARCSR
jgi:hypothetical protein